MSIAHPASFSFNGSYDIVSISVEPAQPEIVNMSGRSGSASDMKMVWTGAYVAPGRITVEAIGASRPTVGSKGSASFSFPGGSASYTAICESSALEARVGDLLRSRFTLVITSS